MEAAGVARCTHRFENFDVEFLVLVVPQEICGHQASHAGADDGHGDARSIAVTASPLIIGDFAFQHVEVSGDGE
ncbi:uncharacterized protein ARB_04763 [Trichophyton benhamiae CBS 112371]|uniref:Uncharacterized protein n=1 Tax=Arthroderma benhamiae (strain ATCC MYA-4681 / CBS 112371) TaxID=663331 RepID=D4AM73_ARTBC|nr:uncharacterized protein ARB_04763 [Trichophyton benhamiae CBS 112371]EFE35829.1 hypothetical protein ARB_04763 [Trichophyton benhamiae CBS 112371]